MMLLEECIKDNFYARFHSNSFHCRREMHFISRSNVNFAIKYRSRALCHGAYYMKSVSRTITMQVLILPASTTVDKNTLFLDSTLNFLDST